jgi:DNA-binding NtrC family response regulator
MLTPTPSSPSGPSPILFVCDDADHRELYGVGMRAHGMAPTFITTIDHARAILRHGGVPVVILHMPADDVEWWNECGDIIRSGTPTIVLTAHVRADGRGRRQTAATGCAAFIAAPCTPIELVRIVERVLAGERGMVWPEVVAGV